jgi:hypothetical protein
VGVTRQAEASVHEHEHAYDSSDGPDHAGRLVIVERCECGAPLNAYVDSVA